MAMLNFDEFGCRYTIPTDEFEHLELIAHRVFQLGLSHPQLPAPHTIKDLIEFCE
jgi:hypothetical protein